MRIDSFRALAAAAIDIEWIVEGLISPGGWTFLVGLPGVGKSMMMIQLCDALQEGKPFLGMATTQHNCLYLQADAGLIEWQQQVSQLAGESIAWTIHQLDKGFLDDPGMLEYLHNIVWGTYDAEEPIAKVLLHRPFTFVVVDCLHAATNGDINTKVAMSTVLKGLERICTRVIGEERQQVHYLLVHHPNATVHKGVQSGAGYKGFSGECGTKLTLTQHLLVLEKSKLCKGKEIELQRLDNGAWGVLGGRIEEDDIDLSMYSRNGFMAS